MDKSKMLRTVTAVAALFIAAEGFAAGGSVDLEPADIDPGNVASLQRGARNFMNYCSGCHSAEYVRYNTIGKHLELSEEQLIDNLMFNAEKTFETIRSAMPAKDAARWYGTAPPDLSLMARAKGADYIFNFLKSFHVDPTSPTGVDNRVLAGTSMPHVLWELQGLQEATFASTINKEGGTVNNFGNPAEFQKFELVQAGSMSPEEYDQFVVDLVNFLDWAGTPEQLERESLGIWVILFLLVLLAFSYLLKVEIWKDIK